MTTPRLDTALPPLRPGTKVAHIAHPGSVLTIKAAPRHTAGGLGVRVSMPARAGETAPFHNWDTPVSNLRRLP